jgi:hypothetical protein
MAFSVVSQAECRLGRRLKFPVLIDFFTRRMRLNLNKFRNPGRSRFVFGAGSDPLIMRAATSN